MLTTADQNAAIASIYATRDANIASALANFRAADAAYRAGRINEARRDAAWDAYNAEAKAYHDEVKAKVAVLAS